MAYFSVTLRDAQFKVIDQYAPYLPSYSEAMIVFTAQAAARPIGTIVTIDDVDGNPFQQTSLRTE